MIAFGNSYTPEVKPAIARAPSNRPRAPIDRLLNPGRLATLVVWLACGISFATEQPIDHFESKPPKQRSILTSGPSNIDQATAENLLAIGYIDSSPTRFDSVGVVVYQPGATSPGFNLYLSSHAAEAILVDMEGRQVYRWLIDSPQLAGAPVPAHHKGPWPMFWRKVHLLAGGDLLAIHDGYGIIRIDKNSNVIWIAANGAHHDMWESSDGRIFVLARTLIENKKYRTDGPVLNDKVLELGPDGTTLQSWSILDALKGSVYSFLLDFSHGKAGDPLHSNSIQVVDSEAAVPEMGIENGDFIISCRAIDTVISLNPKHQTVTWAFTQPNSKQHDARMLEGFRMTLFDNSDCQVGSRATLLDIRTADSLRSFPPPPSTALFSRCCGTTQLLPNGNLLTTFTEESVALETDASGEVVWEFRNPHYSVAPKASPGSRAMFFEVERIPVDRVSGWLNIDSAAPNATEPRNTPRGAAR